MSLLNKVVCVVFVSSFLFLAGCSSANNANAIDKQPRRATGVPQDFKKAPGEVRMTAIEAEKNEMLLRIECNYKDAEAHYLLGRIYQRENKLPQADKEFGIALTLDPVYREAQAARVKTMVDNGKADSAAVLAEEYQRLASNSAMSSLELGLGFEDQDLDEYALQSYLQALRLAPNSAKINRQIGFCYAAKKDDIQAHNYLSRSFQLNPYQNDVANELGRLGVAIKVPAKVQKNTGSLDKKVNEFQKNKK